MLSGLATCCHKKTPNPAGDRHSEHLGQRPFVACATVKCVLATSILDRGQDASRGESEGDVGTRSESLLRGRGCIEPDIVPVPCHQKCLHDFVHALNCESVKVFAARLCRAQPDREFLVLEPFRSSLGALGGTLDRGP